MKRDWDIVRRLLIAIEQLPDENSQITSDAVSGIDPVQAAYNFALMRDGGLIALETWRHSFSGLTWKGHEFLARIRSDTQWALIKATAIEKGSDMSYESILSIDNWLTKRKLS